MTGTHIMLRPLFDVKYRSKTVFWSGLSLNHGPVFQCIPTRTKLYVWHSCPTLSGILYTPWTGMSDQYFCQFVGSVLSLEAWIQGKFKLNQMHNAFFSNLSSICLQFQSNSKFHKFEKKCQWWDSNLGLLNYWAIAIPLCHAVTLTNYQSDWLSNLGIVMTC